MIWMVRDMETNTFMPQLPFKTRILAAATGTATTPSVPDLALPEAVAHHAPLWVSAALSTRGVIDITGSLSWWKAELVQLMTEINTMKFPAFPSQEVTTP